GDVQRYPVFSDADINGTPSSVLMQSRLNIMPVGTMATVNDNGVNPDSTSPPQFYRFPIGSAEVSYTRFTRFPAIQTLFIPSSQPLASDSSKRVAFNMALTSLVNANPDFLSEVFYSYEPNVINQATAV